MDDGDGLRRPGLSPDEAKIWHAALGAAPSPVANRPGANLLRLLEQHGRELAEFAVASSMGAEPRHALANLRQYTHAAAPKWPSPGMIERWAAEIGVDPGEFYRP